MIIIYKLWKDAHTKDFFNGDFQETIAKSNVIIQSKENLGWQEKNS